MRTHHGEPKSLAVQTAATAAFEVGMDEQAPSSTPLETASALSAAALRELQQRTQLALAASREQAARLEADITRQLDDIAASLSEQTELESQSGSDIELHQAEIARLMEDLQKSRGDWLSERQSWHHEREDLAAKADQLEALNRASQDDWRKQLVDFEARLLERQNLWNAERSTWLVTRADLERERDELQQKCELALQDVQRFRSRAAELENDLARRPEVNQADSAELVALRAERDALSERVKELEQKPAVQLDPNAEQQRSDLQRRFELAVEDVRELKTKNAKLEAQLAAAGTKSPIHADVGGMDWESQKRRMLAALAESSEAEEDEARRQERITIEATIEITDEVVAEKDRQIVELTARLEADASSLSQTSESSDRYDPKVTELLDSDEIIAAHRKQAAELERQMDEKLRAAELEISVERAKLARQKAELETLRATLDSQQQSYDANGGAQAGGAPRRRWLSKFGIEGKDKE